MLKVLSSLLRIRDFSKFRLVKKHTDFLFKILQQLIKYLDVHFFPKMTYPKRIPTHLPTLDKCSEQHCSCCLQQDWGLLFPFYKNTCDKRWESSMCFSQVALNRSVNKIFLKLIKYLLFCFIML